MGDENNGPAHMAQIARLEQWKESHEDRCKERFEANARDLGDIKGALLALSVDLKGTVQRIHERNEETNDRINNVTQALSGDIQTVDQRVDKQKIWTLTGLLAGAGAIIAWLVELALKVLK